jgi:hypothetical protein
MDEKTRSEFERIYQFKTGVIFEGVDVFWLVKNKLLIGGLKLKHWNTTKSIENQGKISMFQLAEKRIFQHLIQIFLDWVYFLRRIQSWIRKPRITNKDAEVLFIQYDDQITLEPKLSVFRLDNIMHRLKKERISFKIASSSGITALKRRKRHDDILVVEDYFDEELFRKSSIAARLISKQLKKMKKISYLKDEMDFLFSRQWLQLVLLYYYAYDRIIKKNHVRVVYSIAGVFNETALLAANSNKIPGVISQHGLCPEIIFYDLLDKNYMFLYGNLYKHLYEKERGKNDRLIITGANIFQESYKHGKEMKKSEEHILVLTQPLDKDNIVSRDDYRRYLRKILANLKKFNSKIVIKPHPIEDAQKYNYLKGRDVEIISGKFDDNQVILHKLISKSIFVVSFGSTAVIDAIIMEKPVLLIKLPEFWVDDIKALNLLTININERFDGMIILKDRKKRVELSSKAKTNLERLVKNLDNPEERVVMNLRELIEKASDLS